MGYSDTSQNIMGEASIRRFLVEMNRERVNVCVWKSSDRWEEGLAGKTDVDLLVGSDYYDIAIKNLMLNKWFPVLAEPWRRFDGVADFVSYQEGFTQHLHVHSRIVSGEKLVKSFSPDFTELYLDSAHREGYPYFVQPELEFVTFILRMSLKLGWRDIGRVFKRRKKRAFFLPFLGEYGKLQSRIDRPKLETILDNEDLKRVPKGIIKKASEDLTSIGFFDIWQLRKSISDWRTVKGPRLLLKTIHRKIMKNFSGVGKRLIFGGVSVAICGPDGSGKTTLVAALYAEIGKQMKVRSYYLGGSARQSGALRSCFRGITLPIYLLIRKIFKIVGNHRSIELVENIYTRMDGRMMDRDKKRRLRLGGNHIDRGEIVIYERFPLFSPYGDGLTDAHNMLKEYQPDLVVLINIDSQIARERRPGDQEKRLEAKVQAFNDFADKEWPYKSKLFNLDGNTPITENVSRIMHYLNGLVCQRTQEQKGMEQTGNRF